MRGPIDYIIVGFEGNKFDGSILKALSDAIDNGTVGLIDLALIAKDESGTVTTLNIADLGDAYAVEFAQTHQVSGNNVAQEDIDEMSELLENNTAAGLLVIEHLWAKPLKQAIINANGVLVAEGRIHPDAESELNEGGK